MQPRGSGTRPQPGPLLEERRAAHRRHPLKERQAQGWARQALPVGASPLTSWKSQRIAVSQALNGDYDEETVQMLSCPAPEATEAPELTSWPAAGAAQSTGRNSMHTEWREYPSRWFAQGHPRCPAGRRADAASRRRHQLLRWRIPFQPCGLHSPREAVTWEVREGSCSQVCRGCGICLASTLQAHWHLPFCLGPS